MLQLHPSFSNRYGYLPSDFENVHTLVESMDQNLSTVFGTIRTMFCISYYLLKKTFIHYNLWQQSHSLTLPSEDDNLIRNNFQQRMLFRDILGVCIVLLHFISPLYAFVENFTSYVCVCVSSQNRPTWYKYISWGQELSYNVGSLLSLEAPMLTCICPGWSYHRYWLLLAVNAKVVKGHTLWRMCTTYNVKPAI